MLNEHRIDIRPEDLREQFNRAHLDLWDQVYELHQTILKRMYRGHSDIAGDRYICALEVQGQHLFGFKKITNEDRNNAVILAKYTFEKEKELAKAKRKQAEEKQLRIG